MIERVSFILGAAAACIAVPLAVNADEPLPAPSPEGSPLPTASPSPKPGKPRRRHVHGPNDVAKVPTNRVIEWKMEVLDGPGFQLTAYQGRVVFCNLFATWCGPCRKEQPALVAFARAHVDDTAVIGVNMWEADNDVRAYRKKYEIAYPIAMRRQRGTMPSIFLEHLAFPTTVVFHPDGTLSCAWQGDRDRAWFEAEREYALSR